ncbi:PucR family transcriptional regulator [Streptomyces sp. bgisy031]|uniref:PucR family transcriptional regulator n=1 Tax=Streptomyces sp. bgisy031 TaxID=3413772 RepID=UPI003D743CDA
MSSHHGPGRGARSPHGVRAARYPYLSGSLADIAATELPKPDGMLQHAASLLLGRVAPLAERALARIRAEVGYYTSAVTVPADASLSAHATLEITIASLAFPERFAESGEHAWELGRKRAEEGAPLLAVLQAYRIGGSELWDGMVEAVRREEPAHEHLMLHVANGFWRFVDRDLRLMLKGHEQFTQGRPAGDARKRLPALKALLRGHSDPLDVSVAAVTLDLPLTGRYAVVRLSGPRTLGPDSGGGCEEADGIELNWCPQTEGQAVVAVLRDRPLAQLVDAVASVTSGQQVRAGLSPVVRGLGELGRARELADLALGTCLENGEVACLEDRMSAGFILSRPDLGDHLMAGVLGPVLELEATDRKLLLETFGVWLDCQGSAGRAGERLYCHRNTVFNRLRRLERLTGKVLDRPRDLVDLVLALEAHRLGGAGK